MTGDRNGGFSHLFFGSGGNIFSKVLLIFADELLIASLQVHTFNVNSIIR